MLKRIILTGGGTAGHVTPNLALIPKLQKEGWDVHYIGTHGGIEKGLIQGEGIPYYGISSGKFRRYFDTKNFTDPLQVLKGMREAKELIAKLKPNIVFSKGGFVTVPVVIGSKLNGVPVVIHESDMTPGLANKIAIPFATKVCVNFPETLKHVPRGKGVLTGSPIRSEIFEGSRDVGLELCEFFHHKPVAMIIGGSIGSIKVNSYIRKALPVLLQTFQVVHICGKGNIDAKLIGVRGYKQFEYISADLPHVFAVTDIVISRAGANTLSELLALRKPNLLIPLSGKASRGDQILNARSFEKQGYSKMILEESMTEKTIVQGALEVYQNRAQYIAKMESSHIKSGIEEVMKLIRTTNKKVW